MKKVREPIRAKFVEVNSKEVGGDTGRLIKKFLRLCKKEETSKIYFERMYHKTKSQKRREKDRKNTYKYKKMQQDEK